MQTVKSGERGPWPHRRESRIHPVYLVLLIATPGCSYLLPSCQNPPPCPVGQVACEAIGCSDLHTDPYNCGFCGNACGQGLACATLSDGGAVCSCPLPGTILTDGTCVDFHSDPNNCGGVGIRCGSTAVCLDGGCGCAGVESTDGGIAFCPGEDGGGVCADLRSDASNCGVCGRLCDGGCLSGSCPHLQIDGGSDAGLPRGEPDGGDGGIDGGNSG